jgi:glutaredoxin 3
MKHTIEVFSAGCPLCLEAVQLIRTLAHDSWRVHVYNMETSDSFGKVREYGVTRVPSVAIDGRLASCCRSERLSEAVLRDLLEDEIRRDPHAGNAD